MIAEELDVFLCRTSAASQAAENVQTTTRQVQGFDGEIARLEREIVEHRRPAEELNEDLHRYLGHQELGLQIEETGYTITRGGTPAQTLSEGETTAIALDFAISSSRQWLPRLRIRNATRRTARSSWCKSWLRRSLAPTDATITQQTSTVFFR